MNEISSQQTTPPPETQDVQSRRDFLRSLGKWSGAAIAAAAVGTSLTPSQAQAGAAWVNRGGGWVNRGYGGGGTAWANRGGGGGGGGWVNRGYGGGGAAWVNRGYGGGGGGWVNRW